MVILMLLMTRVNAATVLATIVASYCIPWPCHNFQRPDPLEMARCDILGFQIFTSYPQVPRRSVTTGWWLYFWDDQLSQFPSWDRTQCSWAWTMWTTRQKCILPSWREPVALTQEKRYILPWRTWNNSMQTKAEQIRTRSRRNPETKWNVLI